MIEILMVVIVIVLLLALIYLLFNIRKWLDYLTSVLERNYQNNKFIEESLDEMKYSFKIISAEMKKTSNIPVEQENENKTNKRKHSNVASTAYSSVLDSYKGYEQYKDSKTGLYEPRNSKKPIKLEGDK